MQRALTPMVPGASGVAPHSVGVTISPMHSAEFQILSALSKIHAFIKCDGQLIIIVNTQFVSGDPLSLRLGGECIDQSCTVSVTPDFGRHREVDQFRTVMSYSVEGALRRVPSRAC